MWVVSAYKTISFETVCTIAVLLPLIPGYHSLSEGDWLKPRFAGIKPITSRGVGTEDLFYSRVPGRSDGGNFMMWIVLILDLINYLNVSLYFVGL